jgi:phage/plasmid-associated DNA primase
MGWDIEAYFDINKEDLDNFIKNNNIDKKDWEQHDIVSSYFKDTFLKEEPNLYPMYKWNEECNIHEMYVWYRVSFIRDDERFENRRFQKELEKRVGEPFPHCLTTICWIRTRNDALEVSEGLTTFFKDDEHLMSFAEWLQQTAKYCSTYELSY